MQLIGLAVVLTLSVVLSPLAIDAQQPGEGVLGMLKFEQAAIPANIRLLNS